MKRERRPPKKWRRNMVAAAALLALLDVAIVSATPDVTRIAFALVVSLVVGYVILTIWRSNSKLEKASANLEKDQSGGGKRPVGGRARTGRQLQ